MIQDIKSKQPKQKVVRNSISIVINNSRGEMEQPHHSIHQMKWMERKQWMTF